MADWVKVVLGIVALTAGAGFVAWLGDTLGRNIGRKRLTIFGWRPKRTATFITVATGMLIAAISIGIVLGISQDLRNRLFRYNSTVSRLTTQAETQRELALSQKAEADVQRGNADRQRAAAQRIHGELARTAGELDRQKELVARERRVAAQAAADRRQAEGRYRQAAARAQTMAKEVASARVRLSQAQTAVAAADQRAQTLAAQRAALEKDVADLTRQGEASQAQLREAEANLATAKAEEAHSREQLAASQAEEKRSREQLAASQAEEARSREQLATSRTAIAALLKQTEEAQANLASLEARSQRYEQSLEEMLLAHPIKLAGDELGAYLVYKGTPDATAQDIRSLVQLINETAKRLGAGQRDALRLPGVYALALGRIGSGRLLETEDYLPALVDEVNALNQDVWLVPRVVANLVPGKPLMYTFAVHPDRLAYSRGDVVAQTSIDGSANEATIMEGLARFFAEQVAPAAGDRGMLLSVGQGPEPQVWMPLLRSVQAAGKPVPVQAIAESDLRIGDPPNFRFRVATAPGS